MAGKTSGIDTILRRWREEIKAKQRRIISFEETVDIKISSLKAMIFPETEQLDGWEYRPFTYTRHRERVYESEKWLPIKVGQKWGGPDKSAMFRCKAKMPASFKGKKVVLKIYFGGDSLLYIDGKPYHGLDPFRDTVPLTDKASGKEKYDFEVESYIFWHFGETEIKDFECSYFAVMDQEMNDIYWDFRAAYNVMVMPNAEMNLVEFLKSKMSKAIACIDQNETSAKKFRENVIKARAILRREIYESDAFKREGLIHLSGNSHLDVVFLWTHAEFVRKLGRTHATTLRLFDQFPDYKFAQSQPLMYEEMKRNYPTMFEEVKKRVRDGRWEVIGAMWVEPDCNLLSGESFVRQLTYGISYVEKEFGVTPRTCWCPDVFGNAWTMPQILLKAGLKYFVTHKMVVWNDTNPWTKHTFWWQGPDGSRIFSLCPPTHFIGTVEADHMTKHWDNYSDKTRIGESLYNYGWGDGGGGPDAEMLEYMKRYQDFPGLTPTKSSTIEGALESMYQKSLKANLPIWNDELYLEEHRGVHTTKAKLKKLNRFCENLYRKAEICATLTGTAYPQEKLDAGWKEVLTNQFHDSLPGSHIHPVYFDLLETYDRAIETGTGVFTDATNVIASKIDTTGDGLAVVVFNMLAQVRDTIVSITGMQKNVHIVDAAGNEVPSQIVKNYETGADMLCFWARNLPQVGYAVYHIRPGKGKTVFSQVSVSATTLENDFLKVVINKEGEIVSLYCKEAKRECFTAKNKGNVLKLYEDVPGKYEAWDIAPSYTDVEFDISGAKIEICEKGPVRSSIKVTRRFFNSKMEQRIVLGKYSRRVEFETYVDWHEQQKLLKTRFFTNVTSRLAAYDIPFGTIERSAYRNNSFDEAKFEVPAHYWMDLSQPDFGISILNNCKYGHEAFDGMMSLTLLRGPLNPDAKSDQEEHLFTYAVYPHAGTWREAGTIQQGLDLNNPADGVMVAKQKKGSLAKQHSFMSIDASNVTLEAVKKADKSNDIIVRVVERQGKQAPVTLAFDKPISAATECNLLEREDKKIDFRKSGIAFEIKPFEIRTFKIKF